MKWIKKLKGSNIIFLKQKIKNLKNSKEIIMKEKDGMVLYMIEKMIINIKLKMEMD